MLSDDSLSDTDDTKETKPQDDVKFIVFKQNLYELFKWCPECGAAMQKKKPASTQGTQLFVTLKCFNGHAQLWQSQPMIKGMGAGNLLLSSSILLSGSTYTKMASLAQILKLSIFSEKTFYNIQDKYLFPVINEVWEGEQNAVFADLKNKELWLSGDGRYAALGTVPSMAHTQ